METRASMLDSDLRNGNDCAVNGERTENSPFTANYPVFRPFYVVPIRVFWSGRQWTSISLRADRNSEHLRINSEF